MKIATLFLLGSLTTAGVSAQPELNEFFSDEPAIDCATGLGHFHTQVYLNFVDSAGPDSARITIIRSGYAIFDSMLYANLDLTLLEPAGYYQLTLQVFYPEDSIRTIQTEEIATNTCVEFSGRATAMRDWDCTDTLAPLGLQIWTDEGLPMLVALYRDGEAYFSQERNTPLDTTLFVPMGEYRFLVKKIHHLDTAYADTVMYVEPCYISTAVTETAENQTVNIYPNPASEAITIECSPGELEVVNALGQVIERKVMISQKQVVPVSQYIPGMYFVRTKGKIYRFIVSR